MKVSLLAKGARAPDFTLTAHDGSRVTLSAALAERPAILVFYPGDFTPGCAIQLGAIRDEWDRFRDLGVNVFGVNRGEVGSHKLFAEKRKLPFLLLSDADGNVSRLYGAKLPIPGLKASRRAVFGIDKHGIIRFVRRGMPKTAEILKAMKAYAS